jgi:hypothetical protein
MPKKSITLNLTSETHGFIALIAEQNDATIHEVAHYFFSNGLAHHAEQLLANNAQNNSPYKPSPQKRHMGQVER